MVLPIRFTLALITLFLIAACSETPLNDPLPNQEVGQWTEFAGAENTSCANGSEFKYFVNKGSNNKVVINFRGGGACWNDGTCLAGSSVTEDSLYTDSITDTVAGLNAGIFDHSNAANPVKDWNHVYIPYCTGDLHVGNASKVYTNPQSSETFTIEHKGAVNARSVLDWTFETFDAPESVFITGCSAGAYGAAYWTNAIKANYPNTDVYQLGDCGVGASTDLFGQIATENWNTASLFPDKPITATFTNEIYIETANKYPNSLKMAQYNTLFDQTQIQFYALITGQLDPEKVSEVVLEWSGIMQNSIASIDAGTSNFNSFIAQGSQHCIIVSDDFYTREENGTNLVEWIGDYIGGETVANVAPAP